MENNNNSNNNNNDYESVISSLPDDLTLSMSPSMSVAQLHAMSLHSGHRR